MKKVLLLCSAMLIAAGTATAAPAYVESWDFEDVGLWGAHPDWSAGTVLDTAPFNGQAYTPAPNQRLHLGDNTSAWHTLSQPTNSFIYTAGVRWEAGDINGIQDAGIGYMYSGNDAWFEGNGKDRMGFGDRWLPNPRPGTADLWDNYQWKGGTKSLKLSSTDGATNMGDYYLWEKDVWAMPTVGEAEMMIKYNTPDNPGTVELYVRTLDYDNIRVDAGVWMKLGWEGDSQDFYDFILPTDPGTGEPYAVDQIKMGGDYAWSQDSFDNVVFQSIPEPASLMLLVIGLPMLRRRRA